MKEFGAGMVTGMVVGGIAGVMMDKKSKKSCKCEGAFKSIGAMIDNFIR